MVVCQYFVRGQCKFGDSCRYEHTVNPKNAGGTFGNTTWANRNAVLNGEKVYSFTADSVAKDFTAQTDKPIWPLSSYGPGKSEPNLYGGLDESPEELRVKAMLAMKSGDPGDYQKYETEKIAAADQLYTTGRNNSQKAYELAVRNSEAGTTTQDAAQAITPATSVFAQPPAFGGSGGTISAFGGGGQVQPAFGKSAFGQPAFGQSAFSQPAFGQSGFGKSQEKPASAFGGQANATSAFGSTPANTTGAFGQTQPPTTTTTSAFGQSSQPQSAFNKPSSGFGAFANQSGSGGGGFASFASGGTSAFGSGATPSTSAFGQAAQTPSPFGSNAAPASTTAFGATQPTSVFGSTNKPISPFGTSSSDKPQTSVFGQPSQPQSVFGQPSQPKSVFGQTPQAPSAFGQTSQPTSVFGQPSQPTSAFGQTSQPTSAFGLVPQPISVFGQSPAFGGSSFTSTTSSFGAPAPHPPEKGKVGPPNFEIALQRFRNPQPGKDKYDALLPPNYLELLPLNDKLAFESQQFERGLIPDWIPPIETR